MNSLGRAEPGNGGAMRSDRKLTLWCFNFQSSQILRFRAMFY
jgi:hypothetical protein